MDTLIQKRYSWMKNCFLLFVLFPCLLSAQSKQYQYKLIFRNDTIVYSKPLIDSAVTVLNKRLKSFGIKDATVDYDQAHAEIRINSVNPIDTNYIRLRLIKPFKISFFETYTLQEFLQMPSAGGIPASLKKTENDFYSVLNIDMENAGIAGRYSFLGYLVLKDTSRFYQLKKSIDPYLTVDLSFAFSSRPSAELNNALLVYALKNNEAVLHLNSVLINVSQDFDAGGHAGIQMELNETGTRKFMLLTQNNIGRPLALAIDKRIYMAPFVASPIAGGKIQISGSFSVAEATEIANMLSAGSLPVDLLYKN